jgi:hypothetical protein
MKEDNNAIEAPRFLSGTSGGEWVQYRVPKATDDSSKAEAATNRETLERFLNDVLLSENLVVLAGLGTTLCLNKPGAEKIAPEMSDLWEAAVQQAGSRFEQVMKEVKYSVDSSSTNIEALLSQCQLSQGLNPRPEIARFIEETEAVITRTCSFVKSKTELLIHENFLRKAARRPTRQPRAKLFTTNYDLCFETAASHARFIVVDGFSHTQPQEFDGSYFAYDFVRRDQDRDVPDYIPNVMHLYKIHGSIDWERRDGEITKTDQPTKPLIIYPRNSKFEASYEQPFIEMMSRFQLALRQPNTGFLVVGVGFNDAHIYQPIMSAVRANVSLKAVFVSPALSTVTKEPLQQIESLIRAGDSRLLFLAAGFEELTAMLPDLVAESEDERHRNRLRGSIGRG